MNRIPITDENLQRLTGHQESLGMVSINEAVDDAIDLFKNGENQFGEKLPWGKAVDAFRFRDNEMTLWAGESESGKTMMLSHVMASSVYDHGKKWLVASLEMTMANLAHRFFRQACASHQPEEVHVRKAGYLAKDNVWVYDSMNRCDPGLILGLLYYGFEELKVNHIVIDSLVKVDLSIDRRDDVAGFIDRVQKIAKAYDGHIHLVHHMRKPEKDETSSSAKHRVKGFTELTDLADNVLIVDRNVKKEFGEDGKDRSQEEDTSLIVAKQRNFPWKGRLKLWFDKRTFQFLPCGICEAVEYVK